MSQSLGRDTTHSTQTPKKIDNYDLYEYIGDLVIERADAGDKYCTEIFSQAYRKTREAQT